MSDTLIAYIRTYVPIAVGSVLSWLFVEFGVDVPDDVEAQAAIVATGVVIAAYYALIRTLSAKWPAFGKLLGVAKDPTY